MTTRGYTGQSYDRYLAHNEQSTVHKLKETYWTTKQAVYKKLGKKEDEHVVASDQQLDAKLEVFKAIQKSCMDLLRCLEKYQDRLCVLSQEENAMGRFLKSHSQRDKTRAGKMMAAVGKSLSFSSQQRLALRVPLVRLYQEVETFRYRAISDTLMTINRMEGARTEYRGALMWMKDVSEELDPDTYKQLEKFRKVQAQVKKTKARFDKLKLDTMQKIDLLAASRCNMFSHVLANYQTTLLHFWNKTSHTMSAVAESFKGYQYYEFNMLKELCEPTKQLAAKTGKRDVAERDTDGMGSDGLISFDESKAEEEEENDKKGGSMTNLLQAIDREMGVAKSEKSNENFLDFDDDDQTIEQIKKKQDEQFDFSGQIIKSMEEKKNIKAKAKKDQKDLLSGDYEPDDADKDDLDLLNEIFDTPSTGDDDFTKEWQAVCGNTPLSANMNLTPVEQDQPKSAPDFMPSNLLDMNMAAQYASMYMGQAEGAAAGPSQGQSQGQGQPAVPPGGKTKSKKGQKTDMSAWFNLFADLDPLSNPDAIGKRPDEITDA